MRVTTRALVTSSRHSMLICEDLDGKLYIWPVLIGSKYEPYTP